MSCRLEVEDPVLTRNEVLSDVLDVLLGLDVDELLAVQAELLLALCSDTESQEEEDTSESLSK